MSADKCCCCATKFDNSEGFGKFTSVFKRAGCACVLARENIVRIYKRQGAENVSGRLRKQVREKVFRKPTGFQYSEKGIDFAAKKRYNWRESVHENKNTVS